MCLYQPKHMRGKRGGNQCWEKRVYLVVHHLFVGVVLSEHGEEFNDAGVLYKDFSYQQGDPRRLKTHTSASNLIVKEHCHSQRLHKR